MSRKKQHRKGHKISRKLADIEAISQSIREMVLFNEGPMILCSGCSAEITSADYEADECTQCHTKIGD